MKYDNDLYKKVRWFTIYLAINLYDMLEDFILFIIINSVYHKMSIFDQIKMGNECTKSCTKPKLEQKKPARNRGSTVNKLEMMPRTVHSSFRETINEFSLQTFKSVLDFANEGNIQMIKSYLDQGFIVDFPLDKSGWTLLHLACQNANSELLELILTYKPDINAQEIAEGWTPLMVCSLNDNEIEAKILISKGADKNIQDRAGRTAKQLAEKYKSVKILKII